MTAPSNHRRHERLLIELVNRGELAVDSAGRIWRFTDRRGLKNGGTHLVICEFPRRAEDLVTSGYLRVRAQLDGKRVNALAHRLVFQFFNGDIPEGLTINHRDGVKVNNHPSNLELATYSDQQNHALATGLTVIRRDQLGRFKSKTRRAA